jgi:mRNA-degrading endonuclease toxin of MazEF toxin-antitoxin module
LQLPEADIVMHLAAQCRQICDAGVMHGTFRPVIAMEGDETQVLVEQTTVVDPQRLGRSAGRLDADELRALDDAFALILGL